MYNENRFVCISYNDFEFLFPDECVVAGIYCDDISPCIDFNGAFIPSINLSEFLKKEFKCKKDCNFVCIVFERKFLPRKFDNKVFLQGKFDESNCFAITFNGNLSSCILKKEQFSDIPCVVKNRFNEVGINSIRFSEYGKIQFLMRIENLLEVFFAGLKND